MLYSTANLIIKGSKTTQRKKTEINLAKNRKPSNKVTLPSHQHQKLLYLNPGSAYTKNLPELAHLAEKIDIQLAQITYSPSFILIIIVLSKVSTCSSGQVNWKSSCPEAKFTCRGRLMKTKILTNSVSIKSENQRDQIQSVREIGLALHFGYTKNFP